MCELSNSYVNGFQSWYFPDKESNMRLHFRQDMAIQVRVTCP